MPAVPSIESHPRDAWVEPVNCFGRDRQREQLREASSSGQHVLILGPSGIGKSTLLRAHHYDLRRAEHTVTSHKVSGSYDAADSVAHSIVRQLLEQMHAHGVDPTQVGRAIATAGRNNFAGLAAAAVLDVVSAVAPGVGKVAEQIVTNVRDEISLQLPAGQMEILAKQTGPDSLASLLTILQGLSTAGQEGTLIFDQVEGASSTVTSFVMGLIREAPTGWNIIVAVNDEDPAGIAWVSEHWPTLAYHKTLRLNLSGISMAGVEAWYRSLWKTNPEPAELRTLLTWCEGRPLLLHDWVVGRASLTSMRDAWQRIGPYYDARLGKLSAPARALVQTLSLFPSQQSFPFELIQALQSPASPSEANDVLREVADAGFLNSLDGGDGWVFRHDVIHFQASRNLPKAVVEEFAERAIEASIRTLPNVPARTVILGRLAVYAGNARESSRWTLEGSPALLSAGSFEAVAELAASSLAIQEETPVQNDLRLLRVEALYNLGRYAEAIAELASMDESSPRVDLVWGQVLVRLNRYEEADDHFQRSIHGFARDGDISGQLQAARGVNVMLRDTGEYRAASDLARRLLCGLDEAGDPLLAASIHRTAARSLALQGLRTAEQHALRAIELGSSSLKDRGNGLLALGEALRHTGRFAEAQRAYEEASEIARATGNQDSLLWAGLGKGDCLLLLGKAEECVRSSEEIFAALEADPSRHPLETQHYRLLRAVAATMLGETTAENASVVADRYAEMNIEWPRAYVRAMSVHGHPPYAMRF